MRMNKNFFTITFIRTWWSLFINLKLFRIVLIIKNMDYWWFISL